MPSYDCLIFRQRQDPVTPEFCVFHAPVGEILQWCDTGDWMPTPMVPNGR